MSMLRYRLAFHLNFVVRVDQQLLVHTYMYMYIPLYYLEFTQDSAWEALGLVPHRGVLVQLL